MTEPTDYIPWVEKYRPKKLSDVLGQDVAVERLKAYVKQKNVPHLLFAGPAGTGKCVSGDTWVSLKDGSTCTIKEMVDHAFEHHQAIPFYDGLAVTATEDEILCLDHHDYRITGAPVLAYCKFPKTKTVDVELQSGRKITATPDHVFFSMAEEGISEVPAGKLMPGDLVATARRLPAVPEDKYIRLPFECIENLEIGLQHGKIPFSHGILEDSTRTIRYRPSKMTNSKPAKYFKSVTPELLEFVGYIIADGHLDKKPGKVVFSTADDALLKRVCALSEELFGIEANVAKDKRRTNLNIVRIGSTFVWQLLHKVFEIPAGSKSSKVCVPKLVFKSPNSAIRSFVRALVDCDGHVNKRKGIEYCSASKELVQGIHLLLLRFSVVARIRNRKIGDRTYHYVYIHDSQGISNFAGQIGSLLQRKQIDTKALPKTNSNVDVLPVAFARKAGTLARKLKLHASDFDGTELSEYESGQKHIGIRTARKIVQTMRKHIKRREKIRSQLERFQFQKMKSDDVGMQIKECIIQHKKNTRELSKKAGVSDETIRRLKADPSWARRIHTSNLKKIHDVLGQGQRPDAKAFFDQQIQIRQLLNQAVQILRVSKTELSHAVPVAYGTQFSYLLGKETEISSELAEEAIAHLTQKARAQTGQQTQEELQWLELVCQSDVFWDRVAKVKEGKPQEVYDLTVFSNANFVAGGGIFIHNTTSALALAHELYGDNFRESFHEMNASVTPETPILVRMDEKVTRTTFGELANKYFFNDATRIKTPGLEVLSLDDNLQVRFMPVSCLFRHKVKNILEFRYEGGVVRTSPNHSIMVLDEDGKVVSKEAGALQKGDFLITFKSTLGGIEKLLELDNFESQTEIHTQGLVMKNPKKITNLPAQELNPEFAQMMGLYGAEGCTSIQNNTSGQVVYTFGYPQEEQLAEEVANYFKNKGISVSKNLGRSGFDRTKKSSVQVRVLSTQLTKFFKSLFYGQSAVQRATTKRVPGPIFSAQAESRKAFLIGYHKGDGSNKWGEVARISSVSNEGLIDLAWLAKITGIEASHFKRETRLIFPHKKFSYVKSDLLPSNLAQGILTKIKEGNPRHLLRHSLYAKKSKRVSKKVYRQLLEKIGGNECKSLKKLVSSDLFVLEIKSIQKIDYNDYVYDVSVPGSQVFWGGTIPVLLHNSDERGIDVVRGKIKDFARTMSLADTPFKLIFLDEADALTTDAQQALRRTMEQYSKTCRFILNANYSSRIIEPIQSRCAAFRFGPLADADLLKLTEKVASAEKVKLEKGAAEAIVHVAQGDARKVLNVLQAAAVLEKPVTEEDVFTVAAQARPKEVQAMISAAYSGKFMDARKQLDDLMIKYGLSGEDVMKQAYREIVAMDVPDGIKVQLVDRLGEYSFRLSEGADERIQLEAFLAQVVLAGQKK